MYRICLSLHMVGLFAFTNCLFSLYICLFRGVLHTKRDPERHSPNNWSTPYEIQFQVQYMQTVMRTACVHAHLLAPHSN